MATYAATDFYTLSSAAEALRETGEAFDALDGEIETAIDLLGLRDVTRPGLTAAQSRLYGRAVARQVNFQVEGGVDASVYNTLEQGDRRFAFANSPLRPYTGIDAQARALAEKLLLELGTPADEWAVIRTRR